MSFPVRSRPATSVLWRCRAIQRGPKIAHLALLEIGTSPWWLYAGPQFPVKKVVTATAAQGAILPIAAPRHAPNASYAMTFDGPALQCNNITGGLRARITSNIAEVVTAWPCDTYYGYLSWTPGQDDNLPFVSIKNSSWLLRSGTLGPITDNPLNPNGPATVFVASLPRMMYKLMQGCTGKEAASLEGATILRCQLYDVTYQANFHWSDGAQTVNVTTASTPEGVAPLQGISGAEPLAAQYPNGTYITPNATDPATYNSSIIRTFAYQSVMDAFGEVLVGTISNSMASYGGLAVANTSIMNTIMGTSRDLAFLTEYDDQATRSGSNSFKNWVEEDLPTEVLWDGITVSENTTSDLGLQSAVEQLFQNVTISLMSSALLQ